MFKKILKFSMILLCMGTIFMFSSENSSQSSKKSSLIVSKISDNFLSDKLNDKKRKAYISIITFMVRKSAHFLIYFLLGVLLINFIKEFTMINYKSVLLAIFLAFLYACSDEFHQLFIDGRSCEFSDVLIDTFGAVVGCLIYSKIDKLRRKNI